MTDLEQLLTDHLHRRAADASPRYDLEAIEEGFSLVSLDGLIDLDEHRRRRQRTRTVIGIAAAVALIAAVATLASTRDRDDAPQVTQPDRSVTRGDGMGPRKSSALVTGAYYLDPDGDPSTPLRVTYDVAAEGWVQWIGAMKITGEGHVAVTITTVTNVVEDGCHDPEPADPPVGPSVDDLATALADLAPFDVTAAPSDVTILGYYGKHLELTVPDLPVQVVGDTRRFPECLDGQLRSWISPLLGGPFWGYDAEPGLTEEFWILDVDGTRLVLQTNHSPDSTPEDLAEMQAIFDSIRIEP